MSVSYGDLCDCDAPDCIEAREQFGASTALTVSEGEPWHAIAHAGGGVPTPCDHPVDNVDAMLRRIGWIDQKGRVYKVAPPSKGFDGGSLTPLLINPGCD